MKKKIFLVVLVISAGMSFGQTDSSFTILNKDSKKVKVVAGKEYEMGGLGRIFMGDHWRDLWTTPFEVDVLDLNTFAGGLTPFKRGGGLQTKSLRLTGEDGKVYKFRSIDKDPTRILAPDLQNTFVADAFQDQISTSNPLSAIIVAPMLNAIGVVNSEPIVVYMPNDKKLGEFRKDFGNVLGTLEENPESGEEGDKGFAESDKILNSYKFYKKLEKDNDVQIDNIEFLKARLFDLMVGDWDRHSDQWLWAGYEQDGKMIYKPIPRDRDQAFCLYDGLLPSIVGQSITQIEGYGEDYPKIYDLSFNGRYVDRRFLPKVTKKQYDSITAFIQSRITDEVIEYAVRRMPPEWYKIAGRDLIKMIESRRDKLQEAADEYYELINEVIDIYGSDKKEFVEVNYKGEGKVEIRLYKLDKNAADKKGDLFFQKTFNSKITDEIRIYLNEGKDILKVNGADYSGINIKVIKDNEKLKILGNSDNDIEFYKDERPNKDLVERYEPKNEDRGFDWRFGPVLNYNTDNGLEIGGGPILYKYGFRSKPYVYRMSLLGSYAFGAKSYRFKYSGEFYKLIKNTKTLLNIEQTQLAITRYFGTGNETSLIDSLQDIRYYNVRQSLFLISSSFYIPFSKKFDFIVTPFYKFSDVDYDQNTLLGQNPSTFGIGSLNLAGINGVFEFDTRDHEAEPFKGLYARVLGNYTPNLFKSNFGYSKAGVDLRAYVSTDTVKGFTFAFRAAGGKAWGGYPFYESFFLGGENSLKGFSRERFAGDAALLGQTEVRVRIGKVKILIPGMFGISLFAGTGRVFLEGEQSQRWHSSFGTSIWMTYLERSGNVGFTVAKSDEGYKFFVGTALFL